MDIKVVREESNWYKGHFYSRINVNGEDVRQWPVDLEHMAKLVKVMEAIYPEAEYPTIGGDSDECPSISGETLLEVLEEIARDYAEQNEVYFTYQREGEARQYTPESIWQASGGCEWEESAQYGYDYGWNI